MPLPYVCYFNIAVSLTLLPVNGDARRRRSCILNCQKQELWKKVSIPSFNKLLGILVQSSGPWLQLNSSRNQSDSGWQTLQCRMVVSGRTYIIKWPYSQEVWGRKSVCSLTILEWFGILCGPGHCRHHCTFLGRRTDILIFQAWQAAPALL